MRSTDVNWPPLRQWNFRPDIEPGGHLSWKKGSPIPQLKAKISLIETFNVGEKIFVDIYVIRNEHATNEIPESQLWKRYVTTDANCHEFIFDVTV